MVNPDISPQTAEPTRGQGTAGRSGSKQVRLCTFLFQDCNDGYKELMGISEGLLEDLLGVFQGNSSRSKSS